MLDRSGGQEMKEVAIIGVSGYGRTHLNNLTQLAGQGLLEIRAAVVAHSDHAQKELEALKKFGTRIYPSAEAMFEAERGPVTVENCIFLDALNKKGHIAVITVTDIADLTERNNCFFNRMPFDQKPLIGWDRNGKEPAVQNVDRGNVYTGRRQQPYPAYQKDTNRYDTGSFAANPGLKVFPDFVCKYKSLADWKKNNRKKENLSGKESQILRDHPELLRDLKYFLPTDPEVIKRGCGPRIK